MPVLYLGRNVNHISRVQFLSGFAPLLIITPTRRTKKDLTAVMVDVPVVPAINWTTPSQSPGFSGLNAIQNCIFCTLFDEVLLLSIFPFLQHPILLLPD